MIEGERVMNNNDYYPPTVLDLFERAVKDMEVLLEDCREKDKYKSYQDRIDKYKSIIQGLRITSCREDGVNRW